MPLRKRDNKLLCRLCLLLGGGFLILFAGLLFAFSFTEAATDPFASMKMARLSVGQMESFDLSSLDGTSVRSRDLNGKVVLLNFWATWCGPCKEEMPSLARLQQQFDPKRFAIVTITTDVQRRGIQQFLGQLGITLPVLFDEDQEVSRSFMVRGLPTTILIAPDGHLLGRATGPRAWDSQESIALMRQILEGAK